LSLRWRYWRTIVFSISRKLRSEEVSTCLILSLILLMPYSHSSSALAVFLG
jgi:hypothetical protein